ncbi:hypothetical protein [Aeromicrobium sp.]|uniref:hypothetical protein n=1 Tax=Aeromicrobium sp. TaxID=1871063 RepID=UPI0019CEFBB7|nr:hypothetical protein [Aeromicrobium sp.]MBC7633347.1 hypothetical protein [Aeromicrobium sp.]
MDWLWVLIVAMRGVSPDAQDRWASRLTDLDEVRAEAFATADSGLLREVYVRGSSGLKVDAAMIAAYHRRGARVLDADMRVLSCRVLRASSSRARLDVVDRLAQARVQWDDGSTTALPRDQPSRRVVTLVRTSDGWRIAG